MRTLIAATLISLAAAALRPDLAAADITSDHAAAILVYPRVLASTYNRSEAEFSASLTTDTVIQLSNTSTEPVTAHCFYVNATGRCSLSDAACDPSDADLGCPLPQDLCLPQWSETDFDVVLTPRQPLAWSAIHGLLRADLPLDGRALSGPGGTSNSGTLVPPVRLRPVAVIGANLSIFYGELKCIVVDDSGRAAARNVIQGEATIVSSDDIADEEFADEFVASSKYNALGVQAIDGDANGDGVLELGGDANEYNGCANVLIVQHFFDFRGPPANVVRSELTLVPCTQDFRRQIPGSTTAQFLVFNEFEQRFSTSARVDCVFRKQLSRIDTPDPDRSIFNANVAGTIAGQTRIRGVSQGLLGIMTEIYTRPESLGEISGDAAFDLGMQGDREAADRITVP